MKFNFKKFGEAVKFKRTAGKTTHDKPFSLEELGEALGIKPSTIWRIEHGKIISPEQMIIIGSWAGLNLYDFLENI